MKKKLIVLDFDGTLADTAQRIVEISKATMRELGLRELSEEEIRYCIGLPLPRSFEHWLPDASSELIALCTETYRRLFFAKIEQNAAIIYPGVADTLRRLHEKGVTLAVASSRGHDSLDTLCNQIGIRHYLAMLVGCEDTPHPKPAPDMVNTLLQRLGVQPSEALVVGDTVFDVMMGQGAGCDTCAVTYGNHDRQRLATVSPTYFIDRFADLLQVVE